MEDGGGVGDPPESEENGEEDRFLEDTDLVRDDTEGKGVAGLDSSEDRGVPGVEDPYCAV